MIVIADLDRRVVFFTVWVEKKHIMCSFAFDKHAIVFLNVFEAE